MANVQPRDLAILVKPKFAENQDRICTVIQRIPTGPGTVWPADAVMWFCQFPTPVRTAVGFFAFAAIEDSHLRRLAGPGVSIEEPAWKNVPVPV